MHPSVHPSHPSVHPSVHPSTHSSRSTCNHLNRVPVPESVAAAASPSLAVSRRFPSAFVLVYDEEGRVHCLIIARRLTTSSLQLAPVVLPVLFGVLTAHAIPRIQVAFCYALSLLFLLYFSSSSQCCVTCHCVLISCFLVLSSVYRFKLLSYIIPFLPFARLYVVHL